MLSPHKTPFPQFSCRQHQPGTKPKPWRQLKQIVASEQSLPWPEDAVRFSSIDAPPSFRPAKRYSDVSGLEAPYTDPQVRFCLDFAVQKLTLELIW